jgi:hypothetical protein
MRVAKDKSLDTVRAAHGVKKAAPAKGGRFSAVKAAKNAEVRLGTDKAIKMAEEILRRNGYTIG